MENALRSESVCVFFCQHVASTLKSLGALFCLIKNYSAAFSDFFFRFSIFQEIMSLFLHPSHTHTPSCCCFLSLHVRAGVLSRALIKRPGLLLTCR